MTRPTLIVVSGHPGSGKTTLAHSLARAVPCPAVCRDEIKEGVVHARATGRPSLGDDLAKHAYAVFFDVIELLLRHGVTHVAEAAFKHRLWAPKLEPMLEFAHIRVVQCTVAPEVARERIVHRADDPVRRLSHPDDDFLARLDRGDYSFESYEPLTLDVPTIAVDTTDGYRPDLREIAAFVR